MNENEENEAWKEFKQKIIGGLIEGQIVAYKMKQWDVVRWIHETIDDVIRKQS